MLKPCTVFVIDDDEDDRELFKEVVNEINPAVNCITACNGQEALQLLQQDKFLRPDFIFLDLNLPRFNGKQCLEYIKSKEDFASIPVIIYTTSKLAEDIEETKKMGAAYFITKPNDLRILRKEIELVFKEYGKKG